MFYFIAKLGFSLISVLWSAHSIPTITGAYHIAEDQASMAQINTTWFFHRSPPAAGGTEI